MAGVATVNFRNIQGWKAIFISLLLVTGFLQPTAVSAAVNPTLSGFVRNAADSSPIANVKVHLYGGYYGKSTKTAVDGSFTFSEVPSGSYKLYAYSGGLNDGSTPIYFSKSVAISLGSENLETNLDLTPYQTGSRTFSAVIEGSGLPVPAQLNLGMYCYRENGGESYNYNTSGALTSAETKTLTFVNLPDLRSCTYYVRSSLADGSERSLVYYGQADLTLSNSTNVSVTLKPLSSAVVSGKLVSSQNSALGIPNAYIHAHLDDPHTSWNMSTKTDGQGNFSLTKVPNGEIKIEVYPANSEANGYYFEKINSYSFTSNGSRTDLQVSLDPFPVGEQFIVGTVKDINNVGIPGATVTMNLVTRARAASYSVVTNNNGSFTRADLPEGTYQVSVSAQGFLGSYSKQIYVGQGFPGSAGFKLVPVGSNVISGKLTNSESGQPIQGARVVAQLQKNSFGAYWSAQSLEVTAADGSYTITNVPNGTVSVNVIPSSTQGNDRYLPNRTSSSVTISGVDVALDLTLQPIPTGPASVTGKVVNLKTSAPIPNVSVFLNCYLKTTQWIKLRAITNTDGDYIFPNMAKGFKCNYWASGSDLALVARSKEESFFTVGSENTNLDTVYLLGKTDKSISGAIQDSTGQIKDFSSLVVNARYILDSERSIWIGSTNVEANGSFEFSRMYEYIEGAVVELRVYSSGDETNSNVLFYQNNKPKVIPYLGESISSQIISIEGIAPGDAQVSGTITNKNTGLPIAGITVGLSEDLYDSTKGYAYRNVWTKTDYNGNYNFGNIRRGANVNLNVYDSDWPSDFNSANAWFVLKSNEYSKVKNFALLPRATGTGAVTGILKTPEGESIAGVEIQIERKGADHFSSTVTTNSDGSFVFSDLAKGTYSFVAYPDSQVNGRAEFKNVAYSNRVITLVNSDSVISNFDLRVSRYATGPTTLRGQLWDQLNDKPIENQRVEISGDWRRFPGGSTTTDSQGNWEFVGLAAGEYSVTYSADYQEGQFQKLPPRISVSVSGAPLQTLDRSLANPITNSSNRLELYVLDADTYQPIPNTYVYLRLQDSNFEGAYTTDSHGKLEVSGLLPGEYYIYTQADGYWGGEQDITIIDDQLKKSKLLLKPGNKIGTITGYVKDQWGNPLVDASVFASHDVNFRYFGGNEGSEARTDDSGFYSLSGIPTEKEITLYVSSPNDGNFANYQSKFVLTKDRKDLVDFDVVLKEGAAITGRLEVSDSIEVGSLNVQVMSHATGEFLGSAQVDQDGTFNISNLASGEVDIFVNQWSNQLLDEGEVSSIAFGFVKRMSASTAVLASEKSSSTKITLTGGSSYDLGVISTQLGGSISGQVKVVSNNIPTANFQRSVMVSLQRLGAEGWVDLSNSIQTWTSGWEGGYFTLSGIPDGQYKVSFSEPWPSGTPLTSTYFGSSNPEAATLVTISNSKNVQNVDVVMTVPAPDLAPIAADTVNLNPILEDAVTATGTSQNTGEVTIDLGEVFAGTWVAVTTEISNNMVSAQSLPAVRRASTPSAVISTTGWRQVGPDGKLTIRVSSSGDAKVVVQDETNKVIGWTTVTVSKIVENSQLNSGGGGGGGGGAAAPKMKSPPKLFGDLKLGGTLIASVGEWISTSPLAYSYRWFSCKSHVEAGKVIAIIDGCDLIEGQVSETYLIREKDLVGFIAVEVTANDKVSQVPYATATLSPITANQTVVLEKAPKISGTPRVGKKLTISKFTLSSEAKSVSTRYKWYRCSSKVLEDAALKTKCSAISGAVSSNYKITKKDKSRFIVLKLSVTHETGFLSIIKSTSSKVK